MNRSKLSLWEFSVSVYGTSGMQSLCLDLQDTYDAEVTLLLWSLWLDWQGVIWSHEQWQQGIKATRIARQQVKFRRWLRRCCPRQCVDTRQSLLTWELAGEKQVLGRLEQETLLNAKTKLAIEDRAWSFDENSFCGQWLKRAALESQGPILEGILNQWHSHN